jgi:hypothetical protein
MPSRRYSLQGWRVNQVDVSEWARDQLCHTCDLWSGVGGGSQNHPQTENGHHKSATSSSRDYRRQKICLSFFINDV